MIVVQEFDELSKRVQYYMVQMSCKITPEIEFRDLKKNVVSFIFQESIHRREGNEAKAVRRCRHSMRLLSETIFGRTWCPVWRVRGTILPEGLLALEHYRERLVLPILSPAEVTTVIINIY